MADLFDGLTGDGALLVVGAGFESLSVTPLQLVGERKALSGVRPMTERYRLEKAAEAYQQMVRREGEIPGRADDGRTADTDFETDLKE